VEAIIIKVASMGLKVNMLGKTIGELNPVFDRLNKEMELHICGEGGEYETLTLDCPLFRKKIVPDEIETVVVNDCDIAPVAFIRITRWHLEDKTEFTPLVQAAAEALGPSQALPWKELLAIGEGVAQAAISDALDASGKKIIADRQRKVLDRLQNLMATSEKFSATNQAESESESTSVSVSLVEGQLRVFGLTAAATKINQEPCAALASAGTDFKTVAEEVEILMQKTRICVELFGMKMADICYCWLSLADMRQFQAVNAEYCKHFGVNPPSRACVELPLRGAHSVELECLGSAKPRTVLHVQSISRWAPTCIGPYSQGSMVTYPASNVMHLAGQIGQDPPTMTLVEGGSEAQALACLAHIDSVLGVMCPATQGSVLLWNVFVSESLSLEESFAVLDTIRSKAKERAHKFGGTGDVVGLLVVPCLPRQAAVEIQVVASADPSQEIEEHIAATDRGRMVSTCHAVEGGAAVYQMPSEAQNVGELIRDIDCFFQSIAKAAAARDDDSAGGKIFAALRLYTSCDEFGKATVADVAKRHTQGAQAIAVSVMPVSAVSGVASGGNPKVTSLLQAGCF